MHEAKVYSKVGDARNILLNVAGIPHMHYAGNEGDYNILIMELLGPNLEELRVYCDGKFSLQTTLMLADQMLARLEHVHNNYYLHRDLKPNNFSIGVDSRINVLYLLDFGLAMTY